MAYLESKPRYEILDGLRGVAALKLYDEPIREWLKERWLKKKHPKHT